MSDLWTNTYF